MHLNYRIMPFAPVCFWAFQTRATFWAIFKNFPWSPLCSFTKNAGLGDLAKIAITWPLGHFRAALCVKIFSSLCSISGYKLEDNDIFARVLSGLSKEGYFLGDF